jgi:hypothetical protein
MTVSYSGPMTRAWERMKLALFRPFDLHKWFIVGFSAFLAGLADGHQGSTGSRGHWDTNFRDILAFPHKAWVWLANHPWWLAAIAFLAFLVLLLGIVVLWLSSRGQFMFLDNVIHNKAEIAKPWKEYRKEGDSLFLWRLVFHLACLAAFVMFTVLFFTTASRIYEATRFVPVPVSWILGMGALFLVMIVVTGAIATFLKDFVVPIMAKNRVPATKGWAIFLPLFRQHALSFVLYGLIIFALMIAFIILVVIAGLVTCCIGWFLLVIPYIGTVVTLPFWYGLRAFSVEFLAQFGPAYELFPPPAQPPSAEPSPARP